jgi:peptide deformylase
MILDLVTYDDPFLRDKSLPVEKFNSDLMKLIKDMFDTMYDARGIGLSAVQIGVHQRLFITDVPEKNGKLVCINPVIRDLSDQFKVYEEGCLSIPGISGEVTRPSRVVLEYFDQRGKQQRIHAEGLLATCILHEYDHLDGILFIDKLEPEARLQKVGEYRKLRRV